MRLAIQDSWPNLSENAEREFIARFKIACANIGVDCESVVTSDEINAFEPDAVLVSHEFSRKLTGFPTIGLIWSPLSFFRDDPYRVRSLLSYDGYLVANRNTGTYLKDIQAGLSARKPVSSEIFLPTSYRNDIRALEQTAEPSICYIGVHWDGARHRELFETLSRRRLIACYGPEQSWKHIPESYGGYLPFDGRSVIETLGRHGLALCLHKTEHRAENTPSMRLFEALSVGALPICDEIEFARKNLSEFVSFVDMTQSPSRIADRVEEVRDEVRRNPLQARDQARRAKAWFDANWSLETKIKDTILPFVEEVAAVGRFTRAREAGPVASGRFGFRLPPVKAAAPRGPQCEVVMRSGGRDLAYVERAVGAVSAANSTDFPLGMVVVDYKGRPDLQALCAALAGPDFPIRYIRSEGTGFRSTALWDGLKAVSAPFTAHLDDDDSVFENHYRHLSAAFERNPRVNICYSGVIRVEDEPGYYVSAPNYDGPLGKVIEERRELKFLDAFDLPRMARLDNYIQSNAWMGRTAFVQSVIGEDPELLVVEDVYLYLLLAAHGAFGFTGSPTALWHWRSKSNDNSMLAVDQSAWQKCVDRVRLRLAHIPFRSTTTFVRLLSPTVGFGEDGAAVRKDAAPPALTFNDPIEGGMAFKAKTILTGFHEPETPGIWSSEFEATVVTPLGSKVREDGGVLRIECLGSFDGRENRWLELGVADGAARRIEITDWSLRIVELPLPAGSASPLVLNMRSSHLITPGGAGSEKRALGGFIQSVRIGAETDPQEPPLPIAELDLPDPTTDRVVQSLTV